MWLCGIPLVDSNEGQYHHRVKRYVKILFPITALYISISRFLFGPLFHTDSRLPDLP